MIFSSCKACNAPSEGNHFLPRDLVVQHPLKANRDAVMNSHTDNSEEIDRKTSRSICDAVGERLQQHLRPLESGLPTHLADLMDELRKEDARGRQMASN
jgi:hypothetical protein